jgi:hypothetical protein
MDSVYEYVRTKQDECIENKTLCDCWQAHKQMDLTIKVLEYFAREAEHELRMGPRDRGPMDPEITSHLRVMRHLMSAFVRLHQSPS